MLEFLFIIGGALAVVVLVAKQSYGDFPPVDPNNLGTGLPLNGTMLPDEEVWRISQIAAGVGCDARFLAAIRKAENGGPGREFGVLSEPAPDYVSQATYAAQSINANIARYEQSGVSATEGGRLTWSFTQFMSARYAPIGAANDPTSLNPNWANNVWTWYNRIDYSAMA